MRAIKIDISLARLNSFGVDATARGLFEFAGADDLRWFFARPVAAERPWYVWSGGNNILLSGDYPGTLLHPVGREIVIVKETPAEVFVKAAGAVEWDDLVAWSVERGLGGVENLSLIPGYVGAAPVQNIGAYGVELKETVETVEAYMVETGRVENLTAGECRFGYRDSIFKQELAHKAIILSVTLRLSRQPVFRVDYGDLRRAVESLGGVTPANIRRAVIALRESKLPDPKIIGNAGSFFKNPVVAHAEAEALREQHPDMPVYPAPDGGVKLAAGWLIDRAGWKGARRGNVGVHDRQALVLVNHGGATGAEIIAFAREIQQSVRGRFGVDIHMEVNIL